VLGGSSASRRSAPRSPTRTRGTGKSRRPCRASVEPQGAGDGGSFPPRRNRITADA